MSADGKFQDKGKVQEQGKKNKMADADDDEDSQVSSEQKQIGANKAQQIRPLQAPYCSHTANKFHTQIATRRSYLFVTCYALLLVASVRALASQDNRQHTHLSSSLAPSSNAEQQQQQQRSNEVIDVRSGVDQVRARRHAAAGSLRQRPNAQVASAAPPATSGASERPASNRQQAASSRGNLGPEADGAQLAPPSSRPAVGVKNVTAQNGQSVVLHCIVEPNELGDIPSVSWFRGTGELQLLTFETTTIIPDERFVVHRGLKRENDWALQIKELNRSTDSGLYQCQTSGDASPQLQAYQLNVVEPQVAILGSPDLAVKLGAPINLTCVISQSPDQLQFVFWYRDERMINYDLGQQERGKILMAKLTHKPDTITSNLRIYSARPSDSGNYTCMPSGARPNSIYVHVLEASDKRLIMFQNDDNHQLLAASSQQTTNSAISRLSRGRAYAILVAYLIFASWFQLLAQVQTGVSLALVAVIGLLLGRRRPPADDNRLKAGGRRAQVDDESSKFQLLDASLAAQQNDLLDSPSSSAADAKTHEQRRLSTGDEDPLLEGANTALHLLQTLTSARHQELDLQHQDDEAHECRSFGPAVRLAKRQLKQLTLTDEARQEIARRLAATAAAHRSATPSTRTSRPGPQEPQSSPSGSSSCASTGYNSDTTRTAHSTAPNSATPPANLLTSARTCGAAKCECCQLSVATARTLGLDYKQTSGPNEQSESNNNNGNLDEELEMIELLREQPSAMRLIIEQLRNSAGGAQSSCSAAEWKINRRPATGADYNNKLATDWSSLERVTRCPNKRLEGHLFFGRSFSAAAAGDADEDAAESIYSIPRGPEAPGGAA